MTRVRRAGAAALLATPFVLAFFSGGFFDEARLWAGLAVWALVAVGAMCAPAATGPGWLAAAALAGLCAWTALSAGWAPLSGPALADLQRLVLYLGAFVAGLLLLPAAARAVEPALAAGCVVVIGYALAGRLLPGLVEQEASRTAFGRLEQPLTYWNATGLLAALGAVLAAALAGDAGRPRALRTAAAAAVPLLLCGLVLSFSRGALLAWAVGVVVLWALAPGRVRAILLTVACSVPVAGVALWLDGVRALGGEAAARQREGLVALAVLAAASAAAAWLTARREPRIGAGEERVKGMRDRAGRDAPVEAGAGRAVRRDRRPATPRALAAAGAGRAVRRDRRQATPRALAAAGAVAAVALALVTAGGDLRQDVPATGATPARLVSAGSDRYEFWATALDAWRADPLAGGGAGSFRVAWLRERTVPAAAQDAHSLYLETLAELGVVGAALLAAFVASIAVATARAPTVAAGSGAALTAWALHAGIDWDWEMPAVALPALILAAHLAAGAAPAPASAPPPRGPGPPWR